MKQERAGCVSQVRAVNTEERTIDIIASDFSLDSHNTRLDPEGWELDQFRKNPVILLGHNDRDFPVAEAQVEMTRVEDEELKIRIKFPPVGMYDQADISFNLYSIGLMRGISVGFDPIEWEDVEDERGVRVRIYRRQKLVEVSLVTIPSNDNALAQRAKELNRDVKELTALTRSFEETLSEETEEQKKYREYFEKKQPTNKASTRVLKAFYKARGEKQPKDEVEAWKRMNDLIEEEEIPTPEEVAEPVTESVSETETPEPATENKETTPSEVVAEEPTVTTETTPEEVPTEPSEIQEAPEPERKAYVQIPLADLQEFPKRLAQSYVDAAIEGLKRGLPVSQLDGIIDGMNHAVSHSLTPISHGTRKQETGSDAT